MFFSQEEEGSEELENEGAGELEESLSVSTNKPVRDESQYTIPASSPSAVERTDSYESAGSKSSSPIGGPSEEEEESLKLPEMLTNHSAVGLLPLFPSWSLLCLGHSSIYSHSHGESH